MKRIVAVLMCVALALCSGCATFSNPENIAAFAQYAQATMNTAIATAQAGLALWDAYQATVVARQTAEEQAQAAADRKALADNIVRINTLAVQGAPLISALLHGEGTATTWEDLNRVIMDVLTAKANSAAIVATAVAK